MALNLYLHIIIFLFRNDTTNNGEQIHSSIAENTDVFEDSNKLIIDDDNHKALPSSKCFQNLQRLNHKSNLITFRRIIKATLFLEYIIGLLYTTGDQHISVSTEKNYVEENNNRDGRLVEEEAALIGRVRWSIYLNYFKKIGPYTCALICKL